MPSGAISLPRGHAPFANFFPSFLPVTSLKEVSPSPTPLSPLDTRMRAICLITTLLSICCETARAAITNQFGGEENAFLVAHNSIRSKFNAQPLNWSITLASQAQAWASGCRFEHSDGQLGPYGENIAAGTANFTPIRAMRMFMDGHRTFDPTNPTFSDYTQIIWQSTTELGCASAQCGGIFGEAFGEATMHVCLYKPAGNVVGGLLNNLGIL